MFYFRELASQLLSLSSANVSDELKRSCSNIVARWVCVMRRVMLFFKLMTTLMLMLMLTSVCDEEGEDDEVVVDIDDYVDVDVHVRVDVDVDVDVYELFDNCIVTGWITNPSLRITLCSVMEKRSNAEQIYKTLHCKNKTTYFHHHVLYQRS